MGEPAKRSTAKLLGVLLGGLLLLAAVVQLVEELVPHDRAPSDAAELPDGATPLRPRLSRPDDETILVQIGILHRSRFRFSDEDSKGKVDALYACFAQGIQSEFGPADAPAPDSLRWTNRQVLATMERIQERCVSEGSD